MNFQHLALAGALTVAAATPLASGAVARPEAPVVATTTGVPQQRASATSATSDQLRYAERELAATDLEPFVGGGVGAATGVVVVVLAVLLIVLLI